MHRCGFQSLTGSIHTLSRSEQVGAMLQFQSLTGSIHTIITRVVAPAFTPSFNPSQVQFTQRRILSFLLQFTRFNLSQVQFTPLGSPRLLEQLFKFQSLTGSIHTRLWAVDGVTYDPFQSLTGSIHTRKKVYQIPSYVTVSIPHRFNSHLGFNPQLNSILQFQSLTGSIHTE